MDYLTVAVDRQADAQRDGFTGLLLGSVTHHVAHHVRCPLAVVP